MRICSAIQKRTNNKRIKYFGRSENFVAEPLGEYGLRVIWAAGINDDRGIARHVSKRFLPMERDAIRSAGAKDKGGVKTDVRLRVTEQIAQAGHVGCGSGSLGSGGGKGGMPGLGVGASG